MAADKPRPLLQNSLILGALHTTPACFPPSFLLKIVILLHKHKQRQLQKRCLIMALVHIGLILFDQIQSLSTGHISRVWIKLTCGRGWRYWSSISIFQNLHSTRHSTVVFLSDPKFNYGQTFCFASETQVHEHETSWILHFESRILNHMFQKGLYFLRKISLIPGIKAMDTRKVRSSSCCGTI